MSHSGECVQGQVDVLAEGKEVRAWKSSYKPLGLSGSKTRLLQAAGTGVHIVQWLKQWPRES